jgi:hypothetical protein
MTTPPAAKKKLTRRERTTELTALAVAWLWEKRHCRMIGLEVGFDHRGPGTPWERLRRADVVGGTEFGRQGLIWVFEVKSTIADWKREDLSVGKWNWKLQEWCRPALLCWDLAMAQRVAADLGERPWSVAYPDSEWRTLKWLGRRAEPPPPFVEGERWSNAAKAIACVHTSQMMPGFANSSRNPVSLQQRVAENMRATRHKTEQLDLFLDHVEE